MLKKAVWISIILILLNPVALSCGLMPVWVKPYCSLFERMVKSMEKNNVRFIERKKNVFGFRFDGDCGLCSYQRLARSAPDGTDSAAFASGGLGGA